MDKDWILQTKETRRAFSSATWVPLRASCNDEQGEVRDIGYISEFFGCGSVAFPPEHREVAERFGWSDIGIGRSVQPYAYEDGYYSSIEQYQYNDKEPIGVQLVFEHPQPVVGGRLLHEALSGVIWSAHPVSSVKGERSFAEFWRTPIGRSLAMKSAKR